MIDKQIGSPAEAVQEIFEGATVMIGGFGASGSPIELIHALIDHGAKELTVINNNTGNGEVGLAALIGNVGALAGARFLGKHGKTRLLRGTGGLEVGFGGRDQEGVSSPRHEVPSGP